MAYITGSLTDANPGPALYALMAPALTTAGGTLVDTVTISTRTHKVWKFPAASTTQGLDWYLDIGYTTTGSGVIALIAFEFYDPATDLGYRGPYNQNIAAAIDPTTFSRYGATGQALETAWMSAATVSAQTPISTTAFNYWFSVTGDRACIMTTGAPTIMMFAGFYKPDPLYAAKAASTIYPLLTGQPGGASNAGNSLGITRIAPWTYLDNTGGGPNWYYSIASAAAPVYGPALPGGATTGYPFTAFPVALKSATASSPPGRYGWFRDVYQIFSSGVTRGDTCTIDGSPYVLTSTNGNGYSYAFKAV